MRQYLRFEIELFFSYLCNIMESKSLTYQQQVEFFFRLNMKETILEFIVQFCKHSFLIPELYVNFDSAKGAANIIDSLIKVLHKVIFLNFFEFQNAFPANGGDVHGVNFLCLETLQAILLKILNRIDTPLSLEDAQLASVLQARKSEKILLASVTERFHKNPKECIQFLKGNFFLILKSR